MKRLTLFSVAAMLLFAQAKAQTEVVQGVTQGKDFGVVYTLPKTEIIVSVNVTKVRSTPGEFARYAERYLRLLDVTMEKEEYWLLNTITAQSVGTPDSEKSYFIKLRDRTVAPLVELTKEGLLKSINVPYSAETEKVAAQATAAPKSINPKELLTEEILTANSTAKMAELTAREIYNIRESRNALVRGQADNMPQDGEQLKLMLNTLELQEKALMQLFVGTTESTNEVVKITVVPGKEYKDEVVARFSTKLGVLSTDNLAGEPIYLTLTNMNTVAIPEATDDKRKDVLGVAYNVPGRGKTTLTFNNAKVFEGELPITQYGIVEYLASSLFNKNSVIKVIFNPDTGGLVKIDRE